MFLTELKVRPLDDERHFELTEDLLYYSPLLKKVLTVPKGFDTDCASVPVGFRWLIPFGGRKMKAATLHDYLYRNKVVSRDQADKIFMEAMVAQKVPLWERTIMYYAVRVFGGLFYAE